MIEKIGHYDIIVDFNNIGDKKDRVEIKYKENDVNSARISLKCTYKGENIDLTECDILIRIQAGENTIEDVATNVNTIDGIIDYTFPTNALINGINHIEIMLIKEDWVKTSPKIYYRVFDGIGYSDIEAEVDYPILISLIQDVRGLHNKTLELKNQVIELDKNMTIAEDKRKSNELIRIENENIRKSTFNTMQDNIAVGLNNIENAIIESNNVNKINTQKVDNKITEVNNKLDDMNELKLEVKELIADKANIEDLNKTNAEIEKLKAKDAEIENAIIEDGKKISQNSSKITANEKAIKLKVDNQIYTTDKQNMTRQLENNTSAIDILKEEMSLKVEQTDIANAINSIEVGGTNLVKNSAPHTTGWYWAGATGSVSLVDENSAPKGKAMKATFTNGSSGGMHVPPKQKLEVGKKYSWSVWIKASKAMQMELGHEQGGKKIVNLSTNWQRFTHTFTATNSSNQSFAMYAQNITSGDYYLVHSIKVEEGTKPTSYTQAPEDIEQDATDKANQALNDSKSYTNTEIANTNKKVSEIKTELNNTTSKVSSVESKTTTLEKTAEKMLINNFSRTGNFYMWSCSGDSTSGLSIESDNTVSNYLSSLSKNENLNYISDFFEIDVTKTYKISLMQQYPSNNGTASFYFGVHAYDKNKNNIGIYTGTSATLNINPYFFNDKTINVDTWRTFSGYIYSHDTKVDSNTPKGNVHNFMKFHPNTKYLRIRFLHYRNETYGDGATGKMYFAHPTIAEVDNQIVNTETRLKSAEKKITAMEDAISTTDEINFVNGARIFGTSGAGLEMSAQEYQFKSGDAYFSNSVYGKTLYENGTALSSKYLPLVGGTITGGLTVNKNIDSNGDGVKITGTTDIWTPYLQFFGTKFGNSKGAMVVENGGRIHFIYSDGNPSPCFAGGFTTKTKMVDTPTTYSLDKESAFNILDKFDTVEHEGKRIIIPKAKLFKRPEEKLGNEMTSNCVDLEVNQDGDIVVTTDLAPVVGLLFDAIKELKEENKQLKEKINRIVE